MTLLSLSLLYFAFVTFQLNFSSSVEVTENRKIILRLDRMNLESRVFGAQIADISEFPFIVSLQYRDMHFCGGSLYTPRLVLTAAHCCFHETPGGLTMWKVGDVSAAMGTAIIEPGREEETFERRGIIQVYPHEHYYAPKRAHDIALLLLSYAVYLGDNIKLTNLMGPDDDFPAIDQDCTVVVWGRRHYPAEPFLEKWKSLWKVDLKFSECPNSNKHWNVVCAYGTRRGVCFSDSGGPMICNSTQTGIFSFGTECTNKKKPGYYHKVNNKEWLDRATNILLTGGAARCCFLNGQTFCTVVSLLLFISHIAIHV